MVLRIIVSVFAVFILFLIVWQLRGLLLTPVKLGKNTALSLVLTVFGAAPELEQTVDAICWLRANGTLRGELILRDAGMDAETARCAEILEKKGIVKIIH